MKYLLWRKTLYWVHWISFFCWV